MRTFADTEVQAKLIREIRELYEKRGNNGSTVADNGYTVADNGYTVLRLPLTERKQQTSSHKLDTQLKKISRLNAM